MENVIALTFGPTDQAREAVDALLRLHRSGDIRLEAAAVVERTEDGGVVVLEHAETTRLRGTAGGGVIGALIGLLTGPLGVVAGGATGAVVGSAVDVADAESSEAVLRWLARSVPRGRSAAISVVEEATPGAVDALASGGAGTLLRRTREAVEREITAGEASTIADDGNGGATGSAGDRLSRSRVETSRCRYEA